MSYSNGVPGANPGSRSTMRSFFGLRMGGLRAAPSARLSDGHTTNDDVQSEVSLDERMSVYGAHAGHIWPFSSPEYSNTSSEETSAGYQGYQGRTALWQA